MCASDEEEAVYLSPAIMGKLGVRPFGRQEHEIVLFLDHRQCVGGIEAEFRAQDGHICAVQAHSVGKGFSEVTHRHAVTNRNKSKDSRFRMKRRLGLSGASQRDSRELGQKGRLALQERLELMA